MVVFNQDALAYEPGIIKKFGFSLDRLRLYLLYFIQNRSMKNARGVIFLTDYSARLIQKVIGNVENCKTISHGILMHQLICVHIASYFPCVIFNVKPKPSKLT